MARNIDFAAASLYGPILSCGTKPTACGTTSRGDCVLHEQPGDGARPHDGESRRAKTAGATIASITKTKK